MLRCSIGQIGEIGAEGMLHMQDHSKLIGSVNAGDLVVAASKNCTSSRVLIEVPPVLKVIGKQRLTIRPVQIVAKMHNDSLAVILHVAIFR